MAGVEDPPTLAAAEADISWDAVRRLDAVFRGETGVVVYSRHRSNHPMSS